LQLSAFEVSCLCAGMLLLRAARRVQLANWLRMAAPVAHAAHVTRGQMEKPLKVPSWADILAHLPQVRMSRTDGQIGAPNRNECCQAVPNHLSHSAHNLPRIRPGLCNLHRVGLASSLTSTLNGTPILGGHFC